MSDDDDEVPTLFDLDSNHLSQKPTNTFQDSLGAVPVTILTGFLGSGKTTLLRNILTSKQHNRRIAVIENEFGGGDTSSSKLMDRMGLNLKRDALSVETMIAKDGTDGSSLSSLIELPNGCVCCTVKDSLVSTLENLLSKRSDLDYIIIEASGMADPGPVASIFWLDEALESRLRLDGIVGVVDAKNILMQLESTSSVRGGGEGDGGGDEAARQIAFADRIIVNKTDLVQSDQEENPSEKGTAIQSVLEAITSINPTAPTLLTTFSTMEDLNWVLDTQCFDPERVRDVEATYEQLVHGKCNNLQCMRSQQYCGLCNSSDDSKDVSSIIAEATNLRHRHTSAISTIALFNLGSVDLHKLNSWLASILWPNQDEMDSVLRARLEQPADDTERKEATNNSIRSAEQQFIYRIKGVLSITHSSNQPDDWNDKDSAEYICSESGLDRRRYIVQAVNDLWDVTPTSDSLCWQEDETRCCKVVVIGKWLDEDRLRMEFDECFVAVNM